MTAASKLRSEQAALTMCRIAERLGVGTRTLCGYFRGEDTVLVGQEPYELGLDLILDGIETSLAGQ